ncbi:transcriptional regulator NadR [Bacteroidia bacterium]|nr:transcriptional regulator NadR [Bacteroidia bacterium]
MPLHRGHLALIDFAKQHCDFLTVGVCSIPEEPIPGEIRFQWVKDALATNPAIKVEHITEDLPNSSESSREISKVWSDYLGERYPDVDVIIGSEPYIEYVAEYMGISPLIFDIPRQEMPISATMIREEPFKYWEFIPAHVRGYFVKKICLVGTESTGKTTLTRLLAEHFQTTYVEEMARYLVGKIETVTFEDLQKIASLHAKTLQDKVGMANKLLFVDTDIYITKSYSTFLFEKALEVEDWIKQANSFDLYLFLDPDCEYVQDGTRLDEIERLKLHESHKQHLENAGIQYHVVAGKSREERFQNALEVVQNLMLL